MRQLAVALGVNLNTISKVYQNMQHDGYLVSQRGKGLFVTDLSHANKTLADDALNLMASEFVSKCQRSGMTPEDIVDLVRKVSGASN